MTDRWLILRCSNCKTLELATSLTEAGFEAWSPAENAMRPEKREPVRRPLTPSFVFAPDEWLGDLLALSRSPTLNYQVWDPEKRRMVTRGHPHFRLFQHLGEFVVIPGRQLEPLRNIERRRKPRGIVKPVAAGTAVRMTDGGFAGMTGTVESVRGKRAMVSFPDFPFAVEFPTWLLREEIDAAEQVKVNVASSEQAARAV